MFLKNHIHDTALNYINMSSANIFPHFSNLQLPAENQERNQEKIGKIQERKQEKWTQKKFKTFYY